MEKWKEIKGYESGYLISNYGNVKSLKRFDKLNRVVLERILKTEKTKKGYLRVSLSNKNGVKKYLVHRLVALHFIENKDENKKQINHIDENKSNNCFSNLEWCDGKHNINHGSGNDARNEKKKKKVAKCDDDFNVLEVFDSIKEASEKMGFYPNSLSRLLNNIPTIKNGKKYYQKKIKGYKWKFYDTDK